MLPSLNLTVVEPDRWAVPEFKFDVLICWRPDDPTCRILVPLPLICSVPSPVARGAAVFVCPVCSFVVIRTRTRCRDLARHLIARLGVEWWAGLTPRPTYTMGSGERKKERAHPLAVGPF